MAEVARETEAKLSELATTIDLHDRGVENGWRELLLSDIGREKMEHVRTLGEQLIGYESRPGRDRPAQRLSDAAAEPHRRLRRWRRSACSRSSCTCARRQPSTAPLADEAERVAGDRNRLEAEVGSAHRAAARARPAPADDPRGRAQPARTRAPRRARRPADGRQARRRAPQVAPRHDDHRRRDRSGWPTSTSPERRDRSQAPDHRGPAPPRR